MRQGAISVSERRLSQRDSPVAGKIDLLHRTAPALVLVEMHKAVDQHLARQHLQLRIERRADRQPAFVKLLGAVALVDFAPHFLGEIFGGEDMRAGGPRGDVERRLLGCFAFARVDVSNLDHPIEHVVAPIDRPFALAIGIEIGRRLRQRGEIGRFLHGQLMHRLVEIDQRRGGDAVGAKPEIDFIEIELENLVLGVSALHLQREHRFLDLALERHLVGQQEVLRHLLGDGGGALRAPVDCRRACPERR